MDADFADENGVTRILIQKMNTPKPCRGGHIIATGVARGINASHNNQSSEGASYNLTQIQGFFESVGMPRCVQLLKGCPMVAVAAPLLTIAP